MDTEWEVVIEILSVVKSARCCMIGGWSFRAESCFRNTYMVDIALFIVYLSSSLSFGSNYMFSLSPFIILPYLPFRIGCRMDSINI